MPRSPLRAVCFMLALSGVGCSVERTHQDTAASGVLEQLATDGAEFSTESGKSQGLTYVLFGSLNKRSDAFDAAGPKPDSAVSNIVAGAAKLKAYVPLGCAQATRVQGELGHVHVEFVDLEGTGCSGPNGSRSLRGGLDAQFSGLLGKLHATIKSAADLTSDERPMVLDAEVDVRIDDEALVREVSWSASFDAFNDQAELVHHTSVIDSRMSLALKTFGCVELNASLAGSIGSRGLDEVIDGYKGCPFECPSAGTLSITGRKTHQTVVVVLDGSANAQVIGPNQQTFVLPLGCE